MDRLIMIHQNNDARYNVYRSDCSGPILAIVDLSNYKTHLFRLTKKDNIEHDKKAPFWDVDTAIIPSFGSKQLSACEKMHILRGIIKELTIEVEKQ